ncbi:MAG: VCBS repeat-containing protein [Prosthecobacter sp.]|uniref:PVC-type heme-binding CxxCH protein n=1 Tax=Prosthecobacter sp. TaxID=1965333 RepID=UPI0019ECA643|nr:PVC-type heme-binding CxxCH protein [Prosthecobacter sp.]MBE2284292.1 VCBS repeat-containing protein [Prosthecobacter sp.]
MKTLVFALLAASSLHAATQITWKRQQLHGDFYSEGAAIGDINGDGKPDVVAGPFWWEGPAFEKKHAYYEPKIFSINGYSDNFFAYVHDFDADKKNDILILGFPGKEARLYLNPGTHDDKPWPMHIVADVVDNESPVFTDITGDGKPEIVCSTGGKFGWFAPNWSKPTDKWPFVAVTDDMKVAKFTHGLGVGDVNGDGKLDLLEARRWWENQGAGVANSRPDLASPAPWTQHNFAAGVGGGAQMFAYDFDGNGENDIFTSLAAHRYGVAVFLQNKTAPNMPKWTRVMLASEQPQDNDYGIVFSQPHAAHLADIDGDGVQDIVTGKRYWAHNGHDPDEHGHRVIYWYQTKRDGKGGVDFVPHLIDANTGVGVDVQVGDLNGDKLPDIVVGNKAGVFILTQERKDTTADLTPKKLYGPALKPQAEYAKGQSPATALKSMQLPGGFKAEFIAAEPDLVQPMAFTFDERGRIWVVEGNSYPQPREVGKGQDRIKILEDKDGDGTFETKKIFCEGLNLVSGIELGFGGVWVGAAPYLMFIPRDGDKPLPLGSNRAIPGPSGSEGAKNGPVTQVPGLNFTAYALLDGWGTQDTHETLNSFIWGPDGWLYGCHGVFTHSRVGKPGTPDDQREPINAGVWRYHPVRHEFEVFAHGTSNPWGLDYDQHGEWFVTACVIPHLYHIVPGGRYQRQAGQHFNAHTYEDIKTIADHAHYAGNPRPDVTFDKTTGAGVMNNDTNALGGGHAHCGLAIYQSSLFPPTYRNQLLFGNLHGHRLVANYTDPHASTYIGKHAADFLRANDMHFIPVTQKVGPDGALYVSDWSDQQICHRGSGAVEHWDRSNGRIYRVTYEGGVGVQALADSGSSHTSAKAYTPTAPFDLAKESDETLAKLAVQAENDWFSRMARRVLMEKVSQLSGQAGNLRDAIDPLLTVFGDAVTNDGVSTTQKLRALWAVRLVDVLNSTSLMVSRDATEPTMRVQGIRCLSEKHWLQPLPANVEEQKNADSFIAYALELASATPMDPIVRRELASALQRIPQDQRKDLATALLKHGEDKDDPMIPLLIWYGIEPVVAADPAVGMQLAKVSKMPKVTQFIYRRLSSDDAGRTSLLKLAAETPDAVLKLDLLNALVQAARNGHQITKPDGWDALRQKVASALAEPHPDAAKAAATLLELEASMGIETALATYRDLLGSASARTSERENALNVLLQAKDASTAKTLLQLLQNDAPASLRRKAIQALASLKDAETPKILGAALPKLSANELPDAVNTLASTKEGSKALLKAVETKTVPATALSPFLVRQLTAFDDAEINALIKSAWGDVNAPKADLAERTKKYRDLLTPAKLAKGDLAKGKMLYTATCGQCHKLFGEGQNVGPDITGSNRADLNYLLENVLDPNAVIGKAYQLNLFTMKDGRVMSGVIKEENPAAVKIAMMGGVEFTLPQADIAKREVSKLSTMPEGLFDALQPEMVVDLVKYLQSGSVVPPSGGSGGPAKAGTTIPGALEGESLKVLEITGGKTGKQGMGGFGNDWSGAAQLWWTGGKPDQKLTLAIPVKEAGKYTLYGALTMARDYGVVSITLDGKPVASSFDGYNNPKVLHTGEKEWGTHELTAGEHKLTFTLAPPNPDAIPSNMVGIDYVRLEKK